MSENKPNDTLKPKRHRLKRPKTNTVIDKQAKSTKAEVNQRVSEVQALLLEGRTRSYILKYAEKWKMSDSMIDQYIFKANNIIQEINKQSTEHNLGIITNGLWDLYRRAIEQNNVQAANKVLMDIAKLRGLEQSTINHVIEDKRELAELTDEELDKLLEGK